MNITTEAMSTIRSYAGTVVLIAGLLTMISAFGVWEDTRSEGQTARRIILGYLIAGLGMALLG